MRWFLLLLLVASSACSRAAIKPSAERRIVAIGGPVTETVYALGGGSEIVGVDTSSVFPDEATKLPKVGYQRTLNAEGILSLSPSLVVASNEAGPTTVIDQLRQAGVRVEIVGAEPEISGARTRITRLADITGRDPKPVLATLDADLDRARELGSRAKTKPRVLVLYSRGAHNLHVFGNATFASALVELAGGTNAVTGFDGTKPLTPEALAVAAPDFIVIPSRGLSSLGGLDDLLSMPGVAETPAGAARRVIVLDDLLLLGSGPRTGKAALELGSKIHPELARPPS